MSLPGISPLDVPDGPRLAASLEGDTLRRFPIPTKVVMLNKPLDGGDPYRWLIVDETYPAQIAERRRLLDLYRLHLIDRLDEPGVAEAERELRDHVVAYLLESYPAYFQREGDLVLSKLGGFTVDVSDGGADPMVAVALLASEDIQLMLPLPAGPPEIAAPGRIYAFHSGTLLFANGWSLRSRFDEDAMRQRFPAADLPALRTRSREAAKLGKSLSEIHNPVVQEYVKRFFTAGDAFFNTLRPGAAYWRRNWGPALSRVLCRHPDLEPLWDRPSHDLDAWRREGIIRSEHETFSKLPRSGAVIFTIKTFMWSLQEILASPSALRDLIAASDNLSPDMRLYRDEVLPSFTRWLDTVRPAERTSAGRGATSDL